MHSKALTHFDVKIENVLVSSPVAGEICRDMGEIWPPRRGRGVALSERSSCLLASDGDILTASRLYLGCTSAASRRSLGASRRCLGRQPPLRSAMCPRRRAWPWTKVCVVRLWLGARVARGSAGRGAAFGSGQVRSSRAIWPRSSRDLAERSSRAIWPRCSRDAAEMQPRCGRAVAEMSQELREKKAVTTPLHTVRLFTPAPRA